jgi:hypothetical protein
MERFLAIWGAGLSTVLAVFKILEFRYGQGSIVDITSDFREPEAMLTVIVTNLGRRRLRVRSVTLWFGDADGRSEIVSVQRNEMLGEGDQLVVAFPRAELVDAAHRRSLTPGHSALIYAEVALAGRPNAVRALHFLPPPGSDYGRWALFAATNLFLGLDAFPATRKSTGKFVR